MHGNAATSLCAEMTMFPIHAHIIHPQPPKFRPYYRKALGDRSLASEEAPCEGLAGQHC